MYSETFNQAGWKWNGGQMIIFRFKTFDECQEWIWMECELRN
jgi:hypothetical protein